MSTKYKERRLWMVKQDDSSCERLAFYNLDFVDHKRPSNPEDETLERMADMLDMAAEDCNAHEFVNAHHALAVILHQEVGRNDATRIMRRIVNYEGLHGLVGVCGKGDEKTVESELKMDMRSMPQEWNL